MARFSQEWECRCEPPFFGGVAAPGQAGDCFNRQRTPVSQRHSMIALALQAHFRPEFLNRIDEIVVFHPLTRQHLAAIVVIQLARVSGLLKERGCLLEVYEAARGYLAEVGYDPDFGAWPLKRAIQLELQDPLALQLLAGQFHEGDTIRVDRGPQGLAFTQ